MNQGLSRNGVAAGRMIRSVAMLFKDVLGLAVFLLTVIILVAMFLQALDRYLIGSGFSAYDQLAKIAMVWLAFLGFPLALLHRQTVAADLVQGILHPYVVRIRGLVFDALIAVLAASLVWFGAPVMRVGAFQEIIGTPFTYWSIYLGLNIGMGLVVLILVCRITRSLIDAWRGGAK
ncbi:TRAP transporter small permease [Hwanghaeella sp. LZ110]|uniref:TRAP transporter small permease n=1 Tax=Hwanghaeella sp. LZ110 TaxID=3402810 RepID=UPI003B6833AB